MYSPLLELDNLKQQNKHTQTRPTNTIYNFLIWKLKEN